MSRRTAKFVSALFAGVFAGIPLATVSHGATEAPDSCLAGPKASAPEGSHWYYRIDRATKRHCWYLRAESERVSRAAPAPDSAAPTADGVSPPAPPPNDASTQRAIANARAELPLPQSRVERDAGAFTPQRAPAAAADTANQVISQRPAASNADDQRSVVASRWLDPANMSTSVAPLTPAARSETPPPPSSEAAPASAPATVTLAAADAAPAKPSGSVQMLLIVMVGALSVAGLIGSAIVKLGRPGKVIVDRRVDWDSARASRRSLSEEARATGSIRPVDIPRAPRAADDPDQRISQMLERLARSATG